MKRYVYSVRRARLNLLDAIRAEIRSTLNKEPLPHSHYVAQREAATRDLIASVRAEKKP